MIGDTVIRIINPDKMWDNNLIMEDRAIASISKEDSSREDKISKMMIKESGSR